MSFDQAFTRTIGDEGGYSNRPADRGGETGLEHRRRDNFQAPAAYPLLSVLNL